VNTQITSCGAALVGGVQSTQCSVVGVCCCRRGKMKCAAVKSIHFDCFLESMIVFIYE